MKSKAKVNVNVEHCSFYFKGLNMEIPCPLCKKIVRDGERHECSQRKNQTNSDKGEQG